MFLSKPHIVIFKPRHYIRFAVLRTEYRKPTWQRMFMSFVHLSDNPSLLSVGGTPMMMVEIGMSEFLSGVYV